jgi:hypothetical protein
VRQSLPDAYKWYAIAGENGDAESKERADAIATQLSGPALAAAKQFASAFKPDAFDRRANALPETGQAALTGAS